MINYSIKILTFIFVLFTNVCLAQINKFQNGVYMNLEQFQKQKPEFNIDLNVIKRSSNDIFMFGGNDYIIESGKDSLSKGYIMNSLFAYIKNDSIFLNCNQYNLHSWYSLCLTKGNFIAFKACVKNDPTISEPVIEKGIEAGVYAMHRYLHVMSLRTGNVRVLTKEYLIERLKEFPDLLERYKGENKQESEEILLKYVNSLNQLVSTETNRKLKKR